MEMLIRPAVVALAATLLLSACAGGGEDATPSPSPSSEVSPTADPTITDAISDSREVQGVRLTLSVDKQSYGLDEPVQVRVVVENTTDSPVVYTVRRLNEPPIYLSLVSQLNGEERLRGPGDPETIQQTVAAEELPAGGTIEREVTWDQQLDTYQTPVQAPPGRYMVRAEFFLGMFSEGEEPISHTAAVTFDLEGGQPIAMPLEVITAAVLMPEVQDWLQDRDTLVCALGRQGLFYRVDTVSGNTSETNPDLYQAQVSAGDPICSPVTEGDTWRVIFSGGSGPPPARISAFLDLQDGAPLRVEEGGPKPTPTPSG